MGTRSSISVRAASPFRRISPPAERNHSKVTSHYKYRVSLDGRHSVTDRRPRHFSKNFVVRGLSTKMPKRKLRSCSQCGVRHGPPFGKYCNRIEEAFEGLNREMSEIEATGGEASVSAEGAKTLSVQTENCGSDASDVDSTNEGDFQVIPEPSELEKMGDFGDVFETSPWLPSTASAERRETASAAECREPASAKLPVGGTRASQGVLSGRQSCPQPSRANQRVNAERVEQPPPYLERGAVMKRLERMENLMGKMCGVYQATMERFADVADPPRPRATAQPCTSDRPRTSPGGARGVQPPAGPYVMPQWSAPRPA